MSAKAAVERIAAFDAGRGIHLIPLTLKEAKAYIRDHHRHRYPPAGGLFAIGLEGQGIVCGCVVVGRPVARLMDDSYTAEVTRLCTDGTKNACSMLYAAAWRASRAMGYRHLITYTLKTEPGTSLVAAGWRVVAAVKSESWHRARRSRVDLYPAQEKLRWAIG